MLVWEIVALLAGLASIAVAAYIYVWVTKQEVGNPEVARYSSLVQVGAATYLRRLFQVLGILAAILTVILLIAFGWRHALAFIVGAACSAAAAWTGMIISTKANARVAWAARTGLAKALSVGFYSGSVMGLAVVGFALIGMTVLYMVFRDPDVVLGFSFGASTLALLAKAGGGIYTKTADIGADLVGKVELHLVEDDPRNPAVVADNVGDNVGDVAGMGADIFDSYVASVVSVMVLGAVLPAFEKNALYVLFPLVLCAAGIIASLLGMLVVGRSRESDDPGRALNMGTIVTAIIFAVLTVIVVLVLDFGTRTAGVLWPVLAGLAAGIVIGFTSDFFTDIDQKAVQNTAASAPTGPALVILEGFSYGLLSIVPSIIGICVAMVVAWLLAVSFDVPGTYGVAIAAVGMLSITGMIMSSDAYGPIVDNAKGCAEFGKEPEEVIAVCDRLDAAGNTAKAITKGFAIGAAALTVLALFSAYTETVGVSSLDIRQPGVIVGMFLGAMMPPLFSALLMISVTKNAGVMVEEIRRQFREIPGLLEGKADPDSARCVDIAAAGALKELIVPAVLALLTPLAVGVILGPTALGGFLAGSIVTGILFALLMANAGGLWDNAKKYIEDGAHGGKGSPAHEAAVIGDTVGDPFKDTAGPSLNTLITVMSLSATVFAPLIVKFALFGL
ncbi:MAG: sodium-translocating pyrophosphatase [Anaerolineae bacterium]|jgi:K(+)-stimulated pyrophosphate-energized sodium pump|nr:sodium-translocating pyrophosphatase [Chloroflexota bacterium]